MQVEEILKIVRDKARTYDEHTIYFTLKKMKVRYITQNQVVAIQMLLALKDLGYPFVTTNLFGELMGIDLGDALSLLHRLSAKHILNLIREDVHSPSAPFRYTVSAIFLQHFTVNAEEQGK